MSRVFKIGDEDHEMTLFPVPDGGTIDFIGSTYDIYGPECCKSTFFADDDLLSPDITFDFTKLDVYSIALLIMSLLMGNVYKRNEIASTSDQKYRKLETAYKTSKIWSVLEKMIDPDPVKRIDASTAYDEMSNIGEKALLDRI
jgi:serine/threonine protein kinase